MATGIPPNLRFWEQVFIKIHWIGTYLGTLTITIFTGENN